MIFNRQSIIIPEGLPFIGVFAVITIILAALNFRTMALVSLLITVFVLFFFRNPERFTPDGPGLVISPADGEIIKIEQVHLNDLVQGEFLKISIFMNVFNVHVNRIPYSGTVKRIRYSPGRFISANLDKASALNENNAVIITTDKGQDILTVQIAGLIARRIVCWLKEGMTVRRGERFGLIRFGSRLDVYLPPLICTKVKIGDMVRAGETVLGEIP